MQAYDIGPHFVTIYSIFKKYCIMISYFSAHAMAAVIGIPITKAVQRSSIIVDGHIEKISPCVGVKNKKMLNLL